MAAVEKISRILAPNGSLRVAINLGNPVLAQRDDVTGGLRGVSVGLAAEFGRRIHAEPLLIPFASAGEVFAVCDQQAWDIAFLAIDPVRAKKMVFSSPYVSIEGTYLVKRGGRFKSVVDLDQNGVRIAAGLNTAYDLYLSRTLSHATLERTTTSAEAISLFVSDNLDAAAGVRQPLQAFAAANPLFEVLPDSFNQIEQAMAARVVDPEVAEYLSQFIEEMKASGFVRRLLDETGNADTTVAPPAP